MFLYNYSLLSTVWKTVGKARLAEKKEELFRGTARKREQNGHYAGKPAAAEHGHPHHDLHAGPGPLQRGGQLFRVPDQPGRAERGVPGLPGAEPDDRRQRGHRRGRQRPAGPEPGPGRPGKGKSDGSKRRLFDGAEQYGLCGSGPHLLPVVLHRADRHSRHHRLRRRLSGHCLRRQRGAVLRGPHGAAAPGHRAHLLHHDRPGGGGPDQHHPGPHPHLRPGPLPPDGGGRGRPGHRHRSGSGLLRVHLLQRHPQSRH